MLVSNGELQEGDDLPPGRSDEVRKIGESSSLWLKAELGSAMAEIIDPSALAQRLKESDPPVLVDVRLEEDYASERLPAAKNNCVFEVVFLERMADVASDKGAPVCVYGAVADSYEARTAAEKLSRAGYKDVLELRDGLEGWKSAGGPVEGSGIQTKGEPELNGWREIDTAESRIEWIGRNLLNKHYGQIALSAGKLRFDQGQLASGEFTFDIRSITCENLKGDSLHDVLINHLLSDDFFDAERYPEARFIITGTQPITGATPGSPNLSVRGELNLKNLSRPVEFVATSGLTDEGKPAAQAAFAIDRTLWNVLYGSGKYFRNLGAHLVNDLIEIQLRVLTK
jgi:rhodanese-related sulfurtransferase/polyisoprenoid-binding protein YceI